VENAQNEALKKWIFIALLMFGCSPGVARKDPPKDLIEKTKMIKVMTELMKLEGHANAKYVQVTKYYKLIETTADSLFEAEGITAKQFEDSYEYYASQQTELKQIYEKVLNNLNHELTDIELKEQEQKSKKEKSD